MPKEREGVAEPVLPTVRVLLSLHDGARHIDEQARSIATQTACQVQVDYHLDRDDGHAERLLLARLPTARRRPLEAGLGLPRAYLELLRTDDAAADLYAFADQDDLWHPDKLAMAAAALERWSGRPALWVSRVQPFRERQGRREPLPTYPPRPPRPSFGNAQVETIAPGCVMVWNRALHEEVRAHLPGPGVLMHDAWLYAVAATIGVVVVEARPTVDYRLHDDNAVGINRGLAHRAWRFAGLVSHPSQPSIASQADELLVAFGNRMSDEQRDLVRALAESRRTQLARAWLSGTLCRQSRADNALLLPRLLMAPDRTPAPVTGDR